MMFGDYRPPPQWIPSDPRFGCGPSLLPMEFVEALAKTGPHFLGTSHREGEIKKAIQEIQEGMAQYFQLPEDTLVALGVGGATSLFDMIALTAVEKKVTHFTCGEFSRKWSGASKRVPWIKTQQFDVPDGQGIELRPVADADVICGTLSETSTGVQLPSIPSTPSMDDGTLLAIDATSGAGQISIDIKKTDIFFFSLQKVFASEGGLFIAILSPKAKERILRICKDRNQGGRYYIPNSMDGKALIDSAEKGQTPTTPSLSTLFFLREQLKRMNSIGAKRIHEESKKKAHLLYNWAQAKDYLSPYVEEARFRSLSVATIDVDSKLPLTSLFKVLRDQKVVYGIAPYRKLKRNQLRIGMFPNITFKNLEKLTKLLSHALESQRVRT